MRALAWRSAAVALAVLAMLTGPAAAVGAVPEAPLASGPAEQAPERTEPGRVTPEQLAAYAAANPLPVAVASLETPEPASLVAAAGSTFTPVVPARLLDTRISMLGGPARKAAANEVVELPVAGQAGLPSSGIGAVSLTVTVTETEAPGYLTVYPCGTVPLASNLNFLAEHTIANRAMTALSPTGSVCLVGPAATHLVVDVTGWTETGAGYNPLTPVRVLDTRESPPLLAAGATRTLAIAGQHGVPASGVSAVSLNVTATDEGERGFLSVFPCGGTPPTSSLNHDVGTPIANAVIATLSPTGEVCIFAHADTELVVDLVGWFATDSEYHPVAPTRALDTRDRPYPVCLVPPSKSAAVTDPTGDATVLDVVRIDVAIPGCTTVRLDVGFASPPDLGALDVAAVEIDTDLENGTGCGGSDMAVFRTRDMTAGTGRVVRTPACDSSTWTTLRETTFGGTAPFGVELPYDLVGFKPFRYQVSVWNLVDADPDVVPDGSWALIEDGANQPDRNQIIEVDLAAAAGLPAAGVQAVAVNVTTTEQLDHGYLVAFPCSAANVVTSNLNFYPNRTIAGSVVVAVDPGTKLCLRANVTTHVIVDVNGWFGATPG